MDPSHGKASNFGRRSSTRRSISNAGAGSGAGASDDDDDYDLSAMMVSDGFRPTNNSVPSSTSQPNFQPLPPFQFQFPSQSQNQPQQIPPSTPTSQPHSPAGVLASPKPTSDMRIRPSSISKPPQHPHDSLALRNDGSSANPTGQTRAARVSSLSSDSPVMRVESPYRGPSGPSHPYQMYPQRTLSVTTTSTTVAPAPEHSYSGPRGPTHPYALYAQNTVLNGEPNPPPIPLGFNAAGDTYQRQLGPDGEEAGDLIGPLGHMEELPPYSRYPDNAYVPKDPPQAQAQVPNQPANNEPPTPDNAIAGAGGIGLATRNPEFSSTEDLALSRSHPSIRSNRSEISEHDINGAARNITEKPNQSKWQKRAKNKLWGVVPYWAICLLTVGLIIMGIIMGAVIGTLLSRHKKPPPDDDNQTILVKPSPTTVDVDPLQTLPPDLAPMATGIYGLPPLDTSQAPKTCFNDSSQAQAWSCEMPFAFYSMDVECIPHSKPTNNYQLTLTAVNANDSKFIWGTQPPNIPDPIPLELVNDPYEPGRGPAWWMARTYNKTVIVSEDNFKAIERRGWKFTDADVNFGHRKSMGAHNGDTPWICTWPETTLEIFIYPNQESSNPYAASSSSSSQSYTSQSSQTSQASYTMTNTDTVTTHSYTSPTSTISIDNPAETYDTPFEPPPAYPKVIKMLERRLSNDEDSIAVCRQVEVCDGGTSYQPVLDDDGKPVQVTIVENSQSWEDQVTNHQTSRYESKRWFTRAIFGRNSLELTDCGCLWWST
ncbi:Fc.00g061480.m01.CDS01 [Cosmosporella sp. VM-42]